ncbi:hypothetical protein E3N88_03171 [Mikania micrantha]|uniref:F-box domain-containing protein n=1 Tax=Mikania micrantha TaxID=192012 RepID=A0A5N6Q5T2_9ASTR|nr:hypothetical protein E3N88_03171 [Mikania micrantha]
MMTLTSNVNHQERNWLDIPSDVMVSILNRTGIKDILENAQKVCTVWRNICKSPVMWRVINMNDLLQWASSPLAAKMICKHAIDRSQGQLVDLTLIFDYNAEVFLYAAERSHQLRRLELVSSNFSRGLISDALMNFPLLEELNLYACVVSKEEIETVGRYCPMLKTLKVNEKVTSFQMMRDTDEVSLMRLNSVAIAIGQNLVGLRHLELIGNKMTNSGLQEILDNCHHLEKLDLRACFNIDITGDLGKKCSEQIKHLILPNDSLEGCPYYSEIVRKPFDDNDYGSFEDYDIDLYYDTIYDSLGGYIGHADMNPQERNWLDIPSDVMVNILNRIGIVDILENAQKVCTVWRKICKNPLLWRVINMNDILQLTSSPFTANIICKNAIDRSQGQLVDFTFIYDSDADAQLFRYAVDRSSQLRRLEIVYCNLFRSVISDALMNLPLLEEVNFYLMEVSRKDIETLGRYCPMLKTLKVNEEVNWHVRYLAAGWKYLQSLHIEAASSDDVNSSNGLDDVALAIAQNLVGLRHLELIGNRMTNIGLQAILNHCQYLEKLDLRACFLIDITGDLEKKCFEQIKNLILPNDSLEGCPYYSLLVPQSFFDFGGYSFDQFEDYDMNHQDRNWLDIPSDVMENILNRIEPSSVERVINMNDLLQWVSRPLAEKMICKNAIDRSQGQLVDITFIYVSDFELFRYAVDRSSQLRRLEIVACKFFRSVFSDALMNLPLLEEVNFYLLNVSKKDTETLGRYCPMLKTLKVNERVFWHVMYLAAGWKYLRSLHIEAALSDDVNSSNGLDDMAIAIAQNLVGLRHLELIGNRMTNIGLQAILNHCQYLDKLDFRACFLIDVTGDLEKKCFEQIKNLILPDDSLEGCPYYSLLVPQSLFEYDLDQFNAYDDDDV